MVELGDRANVGGCDKRIGRQREVENGLLGASLRRLPPALKRDPMMAFNAVVGSTGFFITHGFREHAARAERDMMQNRLSD